MNRLRGRLAIAALTAVMGATLVNAPAHAATDFKAMIDAHNNRMDRFDEMQGEENAAIIFTGTRVRTKRVSVFGCPTGTWKFSGVTNWDSRDGGIGFADRIQAKVRENREECQKSLADIARVAEKEAWSPGMEVLEDGPLAINAGEQTSEGTLVTRVAVAPDLVKSKRAEFIDAIAGSKWSIATERQAEAIRPYADAASVDKALDVSRRTTLADLALDDSDWSARWAARFDEIKKVLPKETQRVIDDRFKRLVDDFAVDGKPWSLQWEQAVTKATAGATSDQQKVAAEMVGKRRQTAADGFARDGQPWSRDWEASLSDLRRVDAARADKVIADRRAVAAKAFARDGQSWTPEWDGTIAPLAAVSQEAKNIRSDRRKAYVRDITTNRGWNEVSDRTFQGFLEDNASRRVSLDQSTIALIETWRARTVDGLAANREWSPELEEEFSYLTITYPKAKEEIKKLRENAATKAIDSIADHGWNAQDDVKLAEVAQYQYTPYGPRLDDIRKAALSQLKESEWSSDVDKRLGDLAAVYPLAKDAVEQERAEKFNSIDVPQEWSPEADAELAPLAKVGYVPAQQVLETLRSEYLARLESAEATPERDIELAKLAEVYQPARQLAGSLPPATTPQSPASGDAGAGEGKKPSGTNDGLGNAGAEESESGGAVNKNSSKDGEGSSATGIQETLGIILAVLTALGAIAGMAGNLASQFGMRFPGR
ncbi:MAG: hypothetical protein SOW59_08445 [Corynebacterium sp.]|nr:hypothetical protein [Corynebacterium sp.]